MYNRSRASLLLEEREKNLLAELNDLKDVKDLKRIHADLNRIRRLMRFLTADDSAAAAADDWDFSNPDDSRSSLNS
jgi:hypothetical protein